MPSYLSEINRLLVAKSEELEGVLHYGENIDKGSCLCGIARGLRGRVLNAGNCENLHAGLGLGMMLNGGRAVLYVKQLDFLLLALDQMVNTYNLMRAMPRAATGSFTIVAIVCDQGYQGPQSSLNVLAGMCSLGRLRGFSPASVEEARVILDQELGQPGFRIIALSQRLFDREAIAGGIVSRASRANWFQLERGDHATIACFNFSLPQGLDLRRRLEQAGTEASVFTIHPAEPHDWPEIASHAVRSRRLYLLDDGKEATSTAHKLAHRVLAIEPACRVTLLQRDPAAGYGVSADRFDPLFDLSPPGGGGGGSSSSSMEWLHV